MMITKITIVTAQGVDVCRVNSTMLPGKGEKITHIEEELKQVSDGSQLTVYRVYAGDKMVREISALCPIDITYAYTENK